MAIKPATTIKRTMSFPMVMLAPIAGVTDRAMREICRDLGCPLTFSELISARGLIEDSRGSRTMLQDCKDEHPLVIQLFGSHAETIGEATRMVTDFGADGIDLNLGCPAKKVFKRGSGCGLTIFPTQLVHVIREMRKATDLHFSVKIRAGVHWDSLNYRLVGDIAQGEGVDALTFHARTRRMGFSGEAQWEWIQDLKEYLDIPVIGNGDVVDAESAKKMLDQTGCDGVMIGRGAYGNPWIFRDCLHYLETGELLPAPTLMERLTMFRNHLHLAVLYRGHHRGVMEMRKHLGWYVKGYAHVRPLRDKINRLDTIEDVLQAVDQWLEERHQFDKIPTPA